MVNSLYFFFLALSSINSLSSGRGIDPMAIALVLTLESMASLTHSNATKQYA